MKTHIFHSEDPCTKEAMKDIISSIKGCHCKPMPQLAILFCDVDHDYRYIIDAIYRVFPNILLIGCTSDGEISSEMVSEGGITLALISSKKIKFDIRKAENLSTSLSESIKESLSNIELESEKSCCIMLSDSLTISGEKVLFETQKYINKIPVFGGLSADQWEFKKNYQFFNREILSDAVVYCFFTGEYEIFSSFASGWNPIGEYFLVTKSCDNIVHTINNQKATDFYKKFIGKVDSPFGEYPLAVYLNKDKKFYSYLRAPLKFNQKNGTVYFAGNIPQGSYVRITETDRDRVIYESESSFQKSFMSNRGYDLGIMFNCASRKYLLGSKKDVEINLFSKICPNTPLIGLYCYGEIGYNSNTGYSNFFNQSFVAMVIKE